MKKSMLARLAETIHEHYTWVDAIDHTQHGTQIVQCFGQLHERNFRMLTLIVKRSRGKYRVNHKWNIPEPQIDQAVAELRQDERFSERWDSGVITMSDAEDIIIRASFGIIDLDLEEPY